MAEYREELGGASTQERRPQPEANASATPSRAVLRPPFNVEDMPGGIRRLPKSSKGYPVPWFVDRKAPKRDGDHDFRIMDGQRFKLAIREKRCWVCGEPIRTPLSTFVAGPMCGINRTSAEPPCHYACALWSARACPFLSVPKRIRDEADLPLHARSQAGVGIKRNPGVTMLWSSAKYETWRPTQTGGLLFDIGEPTEVEWFAHGRAATRAEVEESVETGLPILLKDAARESPAACFELGRMTQRFLKWLPPEGVATAPGDTREATKREAQTRPNQDVASEGEGA